jgi:hypothetical protein
MVSEIRSVVSKGSQGQKQGSKDTQNPQIENQRKLNKREKALLQ